MELTLKEKVEEYGKKEREYAKDERERWEAVAHDITEFDVRLDRIEKRLGLEPLFVQDHLDAS